MPRTKKKPIRAIDDLAADPSDAAVLARDWLHRCYRVETTWHTDVEVIRRFILRPDRALDGLVMSAFLCDPVERAAAAWLRRIADQAPGLRRLLAKAQAQAETLKAGTQKTERQRNETT